MVKPFLVPRGDGSPRLSWNLDANVGLFSPNRQDDVELVQLGYIAMSANPAANLDFDLKTMISQIVVGERCTGRQDDKLVKIIFAHQKSRGTVADGHVSALHGDMFSIDFTLNPLLNGLSDTMPNVYPRIEKHPRCGTALRAAVLKGVTL
jgi:hypothetical protein